jgi:hypothetical protein
VKLTSLVVGCALAMSVAPPAHADETDNAYLFGMRNVGIPDGSPAASPAYGRQLCERLPTVGFDPLVAAVNQENSAAGLDMHRSALVIGAAVSNFCLEKATLLPTTLPY